MLALLAVDGLVGFVAGLALLGEQRSGRKLTFIAVVLPVSDIPLDVTLKICALIELPPIKPTQLFAHSGQAA